PLRRGGAPPGQVSPAPPHARWPSPLRHVRDRLRGDRRDARLRRGRASARLDSRARALAVSRVPSDSPADRRIAEARALHRTGDLAGAIAAYASALAADPDRADAWHLKSVAEHQAGRL